MFGIIYLGWSLSKNNTLNAVENFYQIFKTLNKKNPTTRAGLKFAFAVLFQTQAAVKIYNWSVWSLAHF